jgi:hypothetical protein
MYYALHFPGGTVKITTVGIVDVLIEVSVRRLPVFFSDLPFGRLIRRWEDYFVRMEFS